MNMGYIYLLTDGVDFKIGCGTCVQTRINTMNRETGNKGNLTEVASVKVSDMNAFEKYLHTIYEDTRFRNNGNGRYNEFFALTPEQVVEINTIMFNNAIGDINTPKRKLTYREILKNKIRKQMQKDLEKKLYKKAKKKEEKKIRAELMIELNLI